MSHSLFSNNIFFEIHNEFDVLQQELQTMYLLNDNKINEINIDSNNVNIIIDDNNLESDINQIQLQQTDETIFTHEQINKFFQIYQNTTINNDDYNDKNENIKKSLDELGKVIQKQKLQITECCKEKCLQEKINHENALMRFQVFNELSNNEKIYFSKVFLRQQ